MENAKSLKLDNKGLSLVELIIAIAMGVIVSGSIAALITFSIRMYSNESTNTAMQYELQSNINMMMDEIMGASAFVVVQNSGVTLTDPPTPAPGTPYTQYAMFGNPNAVVEGDKGFSGIIFVPKTVVAGSGKFNIYMKKVEKKASEYTTLSALATSEYGMVSGASEADAVKYLLGENATQFAIIADPNGTCLIDTVGPQAKHEYKNQRDVRVKLQFEKNGWGTKVYNKHVDDITYLRNKVTDDIYVDGVTYSIKKKED